MALANYSDLLAALSSWLNRSDIEATYPTFIALFETRANRALRVPQMEAFATAYPTDNELSTPTDFLSAREVYIDDQLIRAMSPQQLREADERFTSGNPFGYALVDQSLTFAPAIDDTVEVGLGYYASIPSLTASNTTNWLMSGYPDAYLYGVLAVAYDYLRDDDKAGSMLGLSDRIFEEIRRDGIKRGLPAGPLIARSGITNG